MLLEGKSLVKKFGGLAAVNNVNFGMEEGEILGLIGPNGAGKTTLFNVITGFYPPDSGRVKFKGEDVTGLKPHTICKKGIGRTFQIVRPFSSETVLENVMVGAFCRFREASEAEEEALRILKFVGLLEKKDVLAKSLTIADRKRLELARALATKPELLLLDEVVAGLNPTEVTEVITTLKRINENGVTLLVIEHVMAAIMSLSHRIMVLHHGEKIAEGTPAEISKDKRVIEAYLGEEYLIA